VRVSTDPTVWRRETALRAAVFIDAADYFDAAKVAMSRARRSIHFLNWTFDPYTRFHPNPDQAPTPGDEIGTFLKRLAHGNPGIDVRVLCWKPAAVIASSPNFFPVQDRQCFKNSRVKFVMDGKLPLGASHHQKVIVIDDRLAFCGGADIGPDRWDTAQHLDGDRRRARTSRLSQCFQSRHEIMSMVDGPAAVSLGVLFRDRWRRATGETVPRSGPRPADPWPPGVEPDFRDVSVGISRAQGAWKVYPEVRETHALTLAAIAAAKRCIYMENQYFTSPVVAEALANRLEATRGPEVVLVSAAHSPSWFDRLTMDRTRGDFIHRLRRADQYGRFRIYSPSTRLGRDIIVHAKLMIVDDELVRVGSANMNNRSTGFDTECDLSFTAVSPINRAAVRILRTRLTAHWLGCSEDEVDEAVMASPGLGAAIDVLRAAGHTRLRPIAPEALGPIARFIAAFHIGDPLTPEDSLRLLLRRKRLAAEVATVRAALAAPAPAEPSPPRAWNMRTGGREITGFRAPVP
jgi:phosphatidylserine/phosphatidylglycerophosphate/cardiolipin synthase-like enzyme